MTANNLRKKRPGTISETAIDYKPAYKIFFF